MRREQTSAGTPPITVAVDAHTLTGYHISLLILWVITSTDACQAGYNEMLHPAKFKQALAYLSQVQQVIDEEVRASKRWQ